METLHRPSAVNWRAYSVVSLLALLLITIIAAVTKLWVLTAIPVGFLFGLFLHKGDLCGSSAFSETIMMRDPRKMIGLWILIVVAMLGFAGLDLLGLVKLSPKPFLYLSYIVGGVVFGVGMVLAGGCISGCIYKGAAGNLNSIVAILGIPVGVMMVEFGPLNGMHIWMKKHVVSLADGKAVSLSGLTGTPFWVLALLFAALTLVIAGVFRRRQTGAARLTGGDNKSWLERTMTKPWRSWVAGVAIGLLMVPAYLSSAASGRNYPLGVTHGVMQAELLLVDNGFKHVYLNQPAGSPASTDPVSPGSQPKGSGKQVVWWLVLEVLSLMLGSWVSARMSGQARLLPKPPDEILFALLGGLMIGIGAAFAGGCVVGNIMSGWALMSVGMFLFGIVTVLSNWAATYVYMMGRQRMR
jgi:uncharacterized membrane protein YedE/YeeE